MVSRASGVNMGGSTTNQSQSGTNTSVTNTNQSTKGSSSSSSSQVTNTNVQNMTSTALGALNSLIAGLSSGLGLSTGGGNSPLVRSRGGNSKSSTPSKQSVQYQGQIDKLNQLASDYSKQAAFSDSDMAVQGALAKALEQTLPTVTAGIQAAGTSGSAMSALLAQKAAEDAAYSAAQVGVDTAIAYGNIAQNALTSAGSLVAEGDPAMNALINALGISKGAVEKGTTKTSGSQSGSSSQTTSGTQTTVSTGQQDTTQVQTPNTPAAGAATTTTPTTTAATPNYAGSAQAFYTPSSYRGATYTQKGNSYSQFG